VIDIYLTELANYAKSSMECATELTVLMLSGNIHDIYAQDCNSKSWLDIVSRAHTTWLLKLTIAWHAWKSDIHVNNELLASTFVHHLGKNNNFNIVGKPLLAGCLFFSLTIEGCSCMRR
jgi:hypothetical protein